MASKYDGNLQRICPTGGQVRVTLSGGEGQGNGGTALPCKGCWVQAKDDNTDVVRMAIGTDASDTVGIDLGRPRFYDNSAEAGIGSVQPLWVPISDVSQLYFYSGHATAVVDILYLVG